MKGFSLLEVLIVAAITGVLGALLVVVIVNSAGLFYNQSSKIGQGLGSNVVLSEIRKVVKEASAVANTYPDTSPLFRTGSTQLILKVPSLDSSSNIISEVFDYFVFYFSDGRLYLKSYPDGLSSRKSLDQILAFNVDNVSFQYFNSQDPPLQVAPATAAKVRITLTLKQRNSGQDFEVSISTSEASLRND